jgi:hypothetical protein
VSNAKQEPERLPTGTVPRDQPGNAWWRYERPELATPRNDPKVGREAVERSSVPTGDPPPVPSPARARGLEAAVLAPPAAPFVILAVVVAGLAVAAGQFFYSGALARVLIIGAALLAAFGMARYVQARHPEEPWIGKLIVWGMIVKIVGTLLRYYVFVVATTRRPDALNYDRYGLQYVDGVADQLPNLRKTNFIFFLTARVYTLIGPDLIAGFLVFGIAAFFGAYFWYRATADAVPSLNRPMYAALVFFAPSLAFWPSSVGKEAVMLLGMGVAALGVSRMLGGRLLQGLALAAPGGWLMWMVRPHLLAFMTVAAGSAYLIGRGASAKVASTSLKRPIGIAIMALLGVLAVSQATAFLGMEDFSISSIEQELADTSAQTSQGGSAFDTGGETETGEVHLTPLSVPQGLVTVLLRPFPWEIESGSQLIASAECALFAFLVISRRRSIATSIREIRSTPFLFFCWVLLGFFSVAYSSFGNMGLLVRQRSLALPAFFALIAVQPKSDRDTDPESPDLQDAEGAPRA